MIGNTIEFYLWPERIEPGTKPKVIQAIVVDAFTEIKGSVTGKSESVFGFGEGQISGSTKSNRMYKIQYYEEWDTSKQNVKYKNINDWLMIKIIAFAGDKQAQETNEEKFLNKQ